MSNSTITQNEHNNILGGDATAAGFHGSSRESAVTPYLTRTNKSTTTPVKNDPFVEARSRSLLDELKVELVMNPSSFQSRFKKSHTRFLKSGSYVECYENPNPRGNSLCSSGLNKLDDQLIESNSENARFSSYNRLVRIIQANPNLDWFFTGTLDPKKWVRNDFKGFYLPFSRFLQHKRIKYVLVPEFHSDGQNIHLHGLFDSSIEQYLVPFCPDAHLPYYILNALEDGEDVRNFPDYQKRFGYVSVSHVRNPEAISHYVSKYILKSIKDSECRVSHRRYYCSKGLNRPYFDIPTFEDLNALQPSYYSSKIVKVYAKDTNTTEHSSVLNGVGI